MDRLEQLNIWVAAQHPGRSFDLAPASADASFRSYLRARFADDGSTRIVMDAPPSHEDCRPFVHVAALFREARVHVPEIYAQDFEQGFLLLSDLGTSTYLNVLSDDNATELYADALGALACIQSASRPGQLPEYSREILLREMEEFPEWYVGRHKGVTLTDDERNELNTVFEHILAINMDEPKVFVHRDFHSRNLMASSPNPGVIDFQDAVYGPMTYDLASLFKDAYIQWDEERTLDWLIRYWETARSIGLPVRSDFAEFHRDYEFMGAQRHIKVLGRFARLWHRDGKDGYLKDIPVVMHYLRAACRRYRELWPLLRLLNKLDPEEVTTGLTF